MLARIHDIGRTKNKCKRTEKSVFLNPEIHTVDFPISEMFGVGVKRKCSFVVISFAGAKPRRMTFE